MEGRRETFACLFYNAAGNKPSFSHGWHTSSAKILYAGVARTPETLRSLAGASGAKSSPAGSYRI